MKQGSMYKGRSVDQVATDPMSCQAAALRPKYWYVLLASTHIVSDVVRTTR